MKIKLTFVFWAIFHTCVLNSQTLYLPNGTGGISTSGNGNIGIGTSLPSSKLGIIDGALHINTPGNGSAFIDDLSTAIVLGPKVSRNSTIGSYYAGLGFNHLLNYSFTTTYNSSNHAWIGLRLVTTPGSEQSDLVFATKDGIDVNSRPIERMCLKYNGYLGIGTSNTSHPLTVKPNTDIDAISWQRYSDGMEVGRLGVTGGGGNGRYGWIGLWNSNAVQTIQLDAGGGNSFLSIGKFGIGTITPSHPLTVKPTTDIDAISWQRNADGLEVGRLGVTGGNGTGRYGWIGLWSSNANLTVQFDAGGGNSFINSGNVGIGTTNPKNLLDVKGTIHAQEVKVDLTGWSDFVFHPSYQLKPLKEVEKFIKTNGHLQDIPSAAEVEKNGVNVGEMQKKLLQKVEELMLYVIEKDKQLGEQNIIIAQQQEMLLELKKEIEKLKQN